MVFSELGVREFRGFGGCEDTKDLGLEGAHPGAGRCRSRGFGLSVPMLALDEHSSELHCHESVFPYLCASSLIGKHITS